MDTLKTCPVCSVLFALGRQGNKKKFCGMACYRKFFSSPEEKEKRSKQCTAQLLNPESSLRKAVVERMTNRNPGDPSATSKRLKGKPFLVTRGGNGRGLTSTQAQLLLELGEGWFPEYVVFAKGTREDWPLMRADLAFPARRIAVECDGKSHNSPKSRLRDAKKDSILRDLGWIVYRFKNQEIEAGLQGIVGRLKLAAL